MHRQNGEENWKIELGDIPYVDFVIGREVYTSKVDNDKNIVLIRVAIDTGETIELTKFQETYPIGIMNMQVKENVLFANTSDRIFAYNVLENKIIWERDINVGTGSSVWTSSGDLAYFTTEEVHAFEAENGKTMWSHTFSRHYPQHVGMAPEDCEYANDVIEASSENYFATFRDYSNKICVKEIVTDKLLWEVKSDRSRNLTIFDTNKEVIILEESQVLKAYDLTGKMIWQVHLDNYPLSKWVIGSNLFVITHEISEEFAQLSIYDVLTGAESKMEIDTSFQNFPSFSAKTYVFGSRLYLIRSNGVVEAFELSCEGISCF